MSRPTLIDLTKNLTPATPRQSSPRSKQEALGQSSSSRASQTYYGDADMRREPVIEIGENIGATSHDIKVSYDPANIKYFE